MPSRALAPVPLPLPSLRLLRAEGRVRALLEAVLRLDAEREALQQVVTEFAASWERRAGAVLAELDDADRLVRRLRRIEDELVRLATEPPPGRGATAAHPRTARPSSPPRSAAPRAATARSDEPGRGPDGERAVVVEPEALALKRLHRRLARAVHPDLATSDVERARLEGWMARVNAAYHRRDLAALEVLAEKIGLGAAPAEASEDERLSRLERRALALQAARDALTRDLERLRTGEAFRLSRECARRAGEGADLAEETRASALDRMTALRAEALARHDACVSRAATFEPARRARGRGAAQRRGVARSPLARPSLTLAEVGRPAARALELARELEECARAPEPWEAALTLLAFFSEIGGRVPETLATARALADRWDALRAGWARAPDLARALARLPRHLELGLRHRGPSVFAGLQLTSAEALAGVRHALPGGALRSLARDVLAVCGPRERCDACDTTVYAVHLLRTRGLDEVHGVACPRCGGVLRSFLRYGAADGIEALVPVALEVGLVAEAHVALGRRTLAFQMLPAQRAALTAGRLVSLVDALYVQPHGLPLQLRHLALEADGTVLLPGAAVPAGCAARLRLSGAAMRERELVSWLRERIESRFRR